MTTATTHTTTEGNHYSPLSYNKIQSAMHCQPESLDIYMTSKSTSIPAQCTLTSCYPSGLAKLLAIMWELSSTEMLPLRCFHWMQFNCMRVPTLTHKHDDKMGCENSNVQASLIPTRAFFGLLNIPASSTSSVHLSFRRCLEWYKNPFTHKSNDYKAQLLIQNTEIRAMKKYSTL